MQRFRGFLLLSMVGGLLAGCTDYAYVGMPLGQPSREIEVPGGQTRLLQLSSTVVGLAYDDPRRRIYIRNLPGTQLQETDLQGNVLRTFAAERVPAGCGGSTPSEFPAQQCGLGIRVSDRHLFMDHPGGLMIAERDHMGAFVRDIRLQSPEGPIGGVAYDQRTNEIYVLFVRNRTIGVYDLTGRKIRSIRPSDPATGAIVQIERFGLGLNSDRREFYVALQNGTRIGAFDLNGAKRADYPGQGGSVPHGIGAGIRGFSFR